MKGPVIRCFLTSGLAALLFFQATHAYAANPADISVIPDAYWGDGSYGPTDHSGDWRPYCSPGATNIVRWYTGDDVLRSQTGNPIDCAVGMADNASYPDGVPGAISLWVYGSNFVPASLPHNADGSNRGSDGDFYFTLTNSNTGYTTPSSANNPAGITVHKDPYWPDGAGDALDYSGDWQPYCTTGPTNSVRWYTSDGQQQNAAVTEFDCAVGMPTNASYPAGVPGAISLWHMPGNKIPSNLPHSFNSFSGGDGDFYLVLTNGNGETYRYEWGWHTTNEVHRFDWGWHNGAYTFPPSESEALTPVIIVPGIMGSAKHNGEWIIDPITHGFDNLIATLDVNGYTPGDTLFTFPYDWHKSNVDTAVLLNAKIDEVKGLCKCEKVDLVAHSMGGLVSRQYIQSDDYDDDVRNMIFIGTPHLGAPEAYLLWEGGQLSPESIENRIKNRIFSNEAYKAGYRESVDAVRTFNYIHSLPVSSVEQLLPVFNYIQNADISSRPAYPVTYPRNTFLEDLNANVSRLTNSGTEITNFVGRLPGNTTIDEIRVTSDVEVYGSVVRWIHGRPEGFGNVFTDQGIVRSVGDELVPTNSASFISENIHELVGNHGAIITMAQADIVTMLIGHAPSVLITDRDYLDAKILIARIFSPADIVIIAPDGKRIGKDFTSGHEVNEISGAYYSGFQTDDEYISIPNPLDGEYKIVTQGTGTGGAYTLSVAIITDATSTQATFSGYTLPAFVTEHKVTVNTTAPEDMEIIPTDTVAPVISISQPATSTFMHSESLPVRVSFTDTTGVATSSVKWDSKALAASSTIDLFYETLGNHVLSGSAVDLVGNATTTTRNIQVIATLESTVSDVNRAYALGWITKKAVRDDLIERLNKAIKIEKKIDTIVVSMKPKVVKTIERLEKKFDKILLKLLIKDMDKAREKNNISARAFQMLSADINWLVDHN